MCIIKLSLPFPSTSGVPTHMEIKGLCQVSVKELTRQSADITCYEKQKVVEAFHVIRLCLKAPVKCKCKHKALGETVKNTQVWMPCNFVSGNKIFSSKQACFICFYVFLPSTFLLLIMIVIHFCLRKNAFGMKFLKVLID